MHTTAEKTNHFTTAVQQNHSSKPFSERRGKNLFLVSRLTPGATVTNQLEQRAFFKENHDFFAGIE